MILHRQLRSAHKHVSVLSVVTALCTIFWQLHMHETCTPDATVAERNLLVIAKFFVVTYLKGHSGAELHIYFLVHLESIYYQIFFYSKIVPNCAVAK